jgi:hypothetical protein
MATYYILRRANGEVFTLERNGVSYIAVWADERDVRRSKSANPDLMLYVPAPVTGRFLKRRFGDRELRFFLVDGRDPDLKRGREITPEEILGDVSVPQAA